MLRNALVIAGLSVFLGGWQTSSIGRGVPDPSAFTMQAAFDQAGPDYRLEIRGPAFGEAVLVFHATSCLTTAPTTFSVPISLDASGEGTFTVPLAQIASMCGGDLILGIELRDASEGIPSSATPSEDMVVLECHPLPVATYGLFDPPYSAAWTTSLPGYQHEQHAAITTFVAGMNGATGLPEQYVFYTASWPLWYVTTGIEGLLPVN